MIKSSMFPSLYIGKCTDCDKEKVYKMSLKSETKVSVGLFM